MLVCAGVGSPSSLLNCRYRKVQGSMPSHTANICPRDGRVDMGVLKTPGVGRVSSNLTVGTITIG